MKSIRIWNRIVFKKEEEEEEEEESLLKFVLRMN
jgi:hypothetical protein